MLLGQVRGRGTTEQEDPLRSREERPSLCMLHLKGTVSSLADHTDKQNYIPMVLPCIYLIQFLLVLTQKPLLHVGDLIHQLT